MIRRLALPALFFCLPAIAVGQQAEPDARVSGQVRDVFSGHPISNALIAVPGTDVAVLSDQDGQFSFVLSPGTYEWSVTSLGYADLFQESVIADGDYFRVGLMPQAISLDEVVVDVPTVDRLFQRRRNSAGVSVRTLERTEFARAGAATLEEYLRRRLGLVMCPAGGVGPNPSAGIFSSTLWESLVGSTACIFSRGRTIPVAVYIDERYAFGGMQSLMTYSPHEVYAIEVWRRGAEVRVFTNRFIERVTRGRAMLSSLPAPPPGGF